MGGGGGGGGCVCDLVLCVEQGWTVSDSVVQTQSSQKTPGLGQSKPRVKHTPVRRDDSAVVTHSVAGASSQLHVLGLAHHNAPTLHLVSHRDEDIASEHVLDFSLLVLP